MEKTTPKATIFVDGSILKKHMLQMGQEQTPQAIIQYLSHMVRAVRQKVPRALITIQYYGSRLADSVPMPISGNPYTEPELKSVLSHHCVPGAVLNNSWGKGSYLFEQPWILKPASYQKENLTDADFVLNDRQKGVLAQLVCKMTENAARYPNIPMYVYGDPEDMAYAMHTAQWLGAKVHQIELHEKTPFISEFGAAKEPHFCEKDRILETGKYVNVNQDMATSIRQLRFQCPEQDKKSVLMLDMGIIRRYLEKRGCRMNVQNVQEVLNQVTSSLPEKPTKTVLYCSFCAPTKLVSPIPGEARALVDSTAEKQILALPNVEFSWGKTIQDRWYPAILKQSSLHVPVDKRTYRDFDYNFHQCDVDDRIACDIVLYGMDPSVSQVYLLATDGDFAYPVEQAARYGLPTSLIHFDMGAKDLSFRLQKWADATINVTPNADAFTSRAEEEKRNRVVKNAKVVAKRKELQKLQRRYARADVDEGDEPKGTKMDRWGATVKAHKREKYERIMRRRRS